MTSDLLEVNPSLFCGYLQNISEQWNRDKAALQEEEDRMLKAKIEKGRDSVKDVVKAKEA